MNIEKMREGFEAWVKREKNAFFLGRTDSPACWHGSEEDIEIWAYNPYDHPWTRGAWDGWKASREALVIELPSPEDQCDDGAVSAINRCIEAIEAAGVKVKS